MNRSLSLGIFACLILESANAATPASGRSEALKLDLSAAVDSDCDGNLQNEKPGDAIFASEKVLRAGQCLIYRTDYRNDGDFAIRQVELRTPVPTFMVYLDGTAAHIETPPGLWPSAPRPPADNRGGDLVWPFKGGLAPGEAGRVEFSVRLMPDNDSLDFVRKSPPEFSNGQ